MNQGICPLCDRPFDYEGYILVDHCHIDRAWKCPHCQAGGREAYEMVLQEQSVTESPNYGILLGLIRKDKKVQQKTLAALAHISTRHLRRYEHGNTMIRLDRFTALCYHLGVTIEVTPR